MSTNLYKVVAVVSDRKKANTESLMSAKKKFEKADSFTGTMRTFERVGEDDPELPMERKNVAERVDTILNDIGVPFCDAVDCVFAQETGNAQTSGKITLEMDGRTLNLDKLPAPFLLYLAHQLKDLETLVKSAPTLDASKEWANNPNTQLWETPPRTELRYRKVQRPLVKYEATKEHPAQVDVVTADIPSQKIKHIDMSGGITAEQKRSLLRRITKLSEQVKNARDEANRVAVDAPKIGSQIIDFIFGK